MFSRLCAILLCVVVVFCFASCPAKEDPDLTQHFTATTPPHAIPALSFEDEKQQTQTLDGFRGRYVVLNLWATWCSPCVREMPALDNLATNLDSKKIAVLALNENSDGHDAGTAFYRSHTLTHLPLYVDEAGHITSQLKIHGLPTTLFINPQGYEIGRVEGAVAWDSTATRALLNQLTSHSP